MDNAFAIERQRQALLRIVAGLYDKIGIAEGGMIARLSSIIYWSVLVILQPVESAVRRLIIAAAQGLVVKARASRPFPKGRVIKGKGQGRRSFPLCDPLRRFNVRHRRSGATGVVPRVRSLDVGLGPLIPEFLRLAPPQPQPAPEPEPEPERSDTVNALPLCRRLNTVLQALKDLPAQARRYARWQARAKAAKPPKRTTPLRRGRAPFSRPDSSDEVHEILRDCHWLAREALKADTS
jgi:hypothetical protein